MSLRETLNRNPALGVAVPLLAVVLSGWFAFRMMSDKGGTMPRPTQAYYTVDDGQTLFPASVNEVSPFEKDGKQAVLAHVFSCDGGKTRFVGYLEKFNDEFRKKVATSSAAAAPAAPSAAGGMGPGTASLTNGVEAVMNRLLKKPGQKDWVRFTTQEGAAAMAIGCPSGDRRELSEVRP